MFNFDVKPWTCTKCTYYNTEHHYICYLCNYEFDEWHLQELNNEFKYENKIDKVKKVFKKDKLILLPVLSCDTYEQFCNNIDNLYPFTKLDKGLSGIFIINANCTMDTLIKTYHYGKTKYPDLWIGINPLTYNAEVLSNLLINVNPDGLWFDKSFIEPTTIQNIPNYFINLFKKCNWNGLYFGGVLFKYCKEPDDKESVIKNASQYVDIITTSGNSTGTAIENTKLDMVYSITNKQNMIATASGNSIDIINRDKDKVNIFMFRTNFVDENDDYILTKIQKLIDTL
jgi:hypothetical protein